MTYLMRESINDIKAKVEEKAKATEYLDQHLNSFEWQRRDAKWRAIFCIPRLKGVSDYCFSLGSSSFLPALS